LTILASEDWKEKVHLEGRIENTIILFSFLHSREREIELNIVPEYV